MKCDGSCEEHTGDVTIVHVRSDNHDWGIFHYCETAIEEDRWRGLWVEAEKGE